LLLPLTVCGEDFYFNNNNNNNGAQSVNNFGPPPSPPISNTYSNTNGNTYSNNNGSTYSNNNGNTYSNTNGNAYSNNNGKTYSQYSNSNMNENPYGVEQAKPVGPLDYMGANVGGMMTAMFGQCMNNLDIEKMMTDDPFIDVKNRCNDQQAATFNSALKTFKTCAGFDLKLLIEEFGSLYIGLLLNCGSYYTEVTQRLDEIDALWPDISKLKEEDSHPLPRVPQQCVDAIVGDNPFGQAFLYNEEFPEQEQKCFSELAGKLPMCALNEWPVPIVGSWLSAISCIYGNSEDVLMPLMDGFMVDALKTLDECIPDGISSSDCKATRNKCLFDNDMPTPFLILPPPFSAPPISDTINSIAVRDGFGGLSAKYEAYRQACIPAADLAVWDLAASHKDKSDVKQGGASFYMESSSEEGENEKAEGEAVPLSAAAPSSSSRSSSSTKFMPGLLIGMIVAFAAMFGYNKYRNGDSQIPTGYHFNSLELS